jgi:hypothetical protein
VVLELATTEEGGGVGCAVDEQSVGLSKLDHPLFAKRALTVPGTIPGMVMVNDDGEDSSLS